MADRGVRPSQLELHAGEAGGGVADRALEEQRRRVRRSAREQGVEILLRGLTARAPRAEHDAGVVVAIGLRGSPGIFEGEAGHRDRVDAGAIEPPELHRRDPRGRLEAVGLNRERRPAAAGVESADRRDAAAPLEQRARERRMRRAECGDDADAGHADGGLHGAYVTMS